MLKNKNHHNDDEIKIKEEKSSLSEFVQHSLPTDEEVKKFDEYAREETKEDDIEGSLNEIYQDDNGDIVDTKRLDIKKGRGLIFWIAAFLFTIMAITAAGLAVYYFYYGYNVDEGAVQFSVTGKEELKAGEEFFYTVDYKNLSNTAIKLIEIKLTYPENFIFLDSVPPVEEKNNFWQVRSLDAHRSGRIKIKGKIIAPKDTTNILLGSMTYTPSNFSSEFKKEAVFENTISDIGINFTIEPDTNILVNKEHEIIIKYEADKDSYLNNFRLRLENLDNMELRPLSADGKGGSEDNILFQSGAWHFSDIGTEEREISIKFAVTEKKDPTQELILIFDASEDGENYYKFLEEKVSFEVIKNYLDLNLIINGSRDNEGIEAGKTLNYLISYANQGDVDMKDVIIMAVLESEILDWQTLDDKNNGKIGDNTISWSKNEIPELESLGKGEEGVISFSIKALPFSELDLSLKTNYQVKSYAQFNIGNVEVKGEDDTRSNIIISQINSDLKLDEQVRYFNDDNIAVGFGPLPPKVGETTSYKVYWALTNNLHELRDTIVEISLPDYVSWGNKNRTSVGSVRYDSESHKVVWTIGRLPITVFRADAEFNISITPTAKDINKILVLLPGSVIKAVDSETGSIISKTAKAKTTILEDDEIAESDGRVRNK